MPEQADQYLDLLFPIRGMDLYESFMAQREGTTRIGTNVRAFEALTQRGRGGSRPGIAKYIPAQLPTGAKVIQHLNIIVDPTPDATLDTDSLDPDAVDDPTTNPVGSDPTDPNDHRVRNRGRKIRKGGWGRQPNRNRFQKKSQIKYIQSAAEITSSDGSGAAVAFLANVAKGHLLIAGVLDTETTVGNTVGMSDTLGNSYTRAGNYLRLTNAVDPSLSGEIVLSIWYAISAADGACAIKAVGAVQNLGGFPVASGAFPISVSEYSGANSASPLDATSAGVLGAEVDAGPFDMLAGSLNASTNKGLVVAFFSCQDSFVSVKPFTAGTGFTKLTEAASAFGPNSAEYQTTPPTGAMTPDMTIASAFVTYPMGLAASFKP